MSNSSFTLLALTVGKQMVRRELRTDPGQVIHVIRESVNRPSGGRSRRAACTCIRRTLPSFARCLPS